MIKLLQLNLPTNKTLLTEQLDSLYSFIDEIKLPYEFKHLAFPDDFVSEKFYLLMPSFFTNVFGIRRSRFLSDISISGFLYFKYLICIDNLNDQDFVSIGLTKEQHNQKLSLQAHLYHEQAIKILGNYFKRDDFFWDAWNKRNAEFLNSILMDKNYDANISIEKYESLSIGKCAFSKAAIDSLYSRKKNISENDYKQLLKANDFFSIARCIQDDIEDFKKDCIHKKNNIGHSLLGKWLNQEGKDFESYSPEQLEKYFILSEVAENLMDLSKEYYKKALDISITFEVKLSDYTKIIKSLINSLTFYKVQTESYRIDKLNGLKISSKQIKKENNLNESINHAESYLNKMQNENGSWQEISNKQGLSNVWATAFIAMFLENNSPIKKLATEFINRHKQGLLWGYNTDWSYDYDSSTCALILLSNYSYDISKTFDLWKNGQQEDGGFSTYSSKDPVILDNLGLSRNLTKGWTKSHICVSALSYYYLTRSKETQNKNQSVLKPLREFLKKNICDDGIWKPYWWTSSIYPTTFILQGMLNDDFFGIREVKPYADVLVKKQNISGSFNCDMLKEESVFYTSLVLDTLCCDKRLFNIYRKEVIKMKNWVVKQQYDDDHFPNSLILTIPNPNSTEWNFNDSSFKIDFYGAGNSITGELYGIFSTAVAYRALKRFALLSKENC